MTFSPTPSTILGFAILAVTAVYFLWGLLTRRYYAVEKVRKKGSKHGRATRYFHDRAGLYVLIGMSVFIALVIAASAVVTRRFGLMWLELFMAALILVTKLFHWCALPLLLHTVYLSLIGIYFALSPAVYGRVTGWLTGGLLPLYIAAGILVAMALFIHLRQER